MRVLLLAHGFPPGSTGGTEIYVHDLAIALGRAGLDVTVIAREADPARPENDVRLEIRDGVAAWFVNNTYAQSRGIEDCYRNPRLGAVLAALVDHVRPDVAHIHHLTGLSTDLLHHFGRRAIPAVFTLHDYWLLCHRGQLLDLDLRRCEGLAGCRNCIGLAGTADRLASLSRASLSRDCAEDRRRKGIQSALGSVDRFLAPSHSLLERFVASGMVERRRMVFHEQGIDLAPFTGRARTPGDRLRLGFLGTLMASKAPHLLLEAVAGIEPGRVGVDLFGAIAPYHGDDSYRDRLRPLLDRKDVHHHGSIAHADLVPRLFDLDAVVVPSIWWENAPLVVREAHAAGAPVVAADIGGMAEMVVHERSGLLFRAGDSADLRRAIRRLLDEPDLLTRLRGGIPGVRSIDADAEETIAIYRSVARRSRRNPPHGPAPRLAAIVLNYRTPVDTLLGCRSLRSSRRPPDDLVVVDNCSGDGSAEYLRAHLPDVRIVETPRNLGYAGGMNAGIRDVLGRAAGRVFLLTGDALVAPDALDRMERVFDGLSEAGIVGPLVLARSDPSRIASAGIQFSESTGRVRHRLHGHRFDPAQPLPVEPVDAIDGCAMLVRAEVFQRVGLLHEAFFFYFEDVDFCRMARAAGFACLLAGDALAWHEGARSIDLRSPLRHYYAARNHLLAVARANDGDGISGIARGVVVTGLNLAYAAARSPAPANAALGAAIAGTLDHVRGRRGKFEGRP